MEAKDRFRETLLLNKPSIELNFRYLTAERLEMAGDDRDGFNGSY